VHKSLVVAYLNSCGVKGLHRILTTKVASELSAGGNIGFVLDEFPKELRAFRSRQKKAESLLILMIDADQGEVDDRRKVLNERARQASLEPIQKDESVALLIPKRHIETWICALLGDTVTEVDDCKRNRPPTKEQVRQAAEQLYEWSRPNATPGSSCVPSLFVALPVWQLIGSRLQQ
jgi:hypothetical protein